MHIGHYFSVIKPALEQDANVLIADHHAPLDRRSSHTVITLERFGVKSEKILHQKDVFVGSLFFGLLAHASMGDLERMTQFKSTPEKDRTAHLLTYPVLMAHDVYGYDEVLVGDDQKQHVEYARRLIARYHNQAFENTGLHQYLNFSLPVPVLVGGRIMSLIDPTQKMSKSQPNGCLFLTDSADDVRQKVGRAVTTPAGIEALKGLYGRLEGAALDFDPAANCKQFKERLAELLIERLTIKY